MKEFIFDRLINRENICGLRQEAARMNNLVEQKQNIVLYAPRNFGKTSLVKNVTIPDFCAKNKKNFVFFVDLMGVKNIESIVDRLKNALEISLKESFPLKNLLSSVVNYFANLKAELTIDVAEAKPIVRIASKNNNKITIDDIFQVIDKIGKDIPSLIVIDEFQDISLIEEAEGLFRNSFQQINNLPIIVLGSKKHLLKDIFALPDSPLANWGKDLSIGPVDYNEYHDYIEERFAQKGLKISFDSNKYLQDEMGRVPESINMLCYEIYHNYDGAEITQKEIDDMICQLIDMRRKRFEVMLSGFSVAEEKILAQIAKEGKAHKVQSKEFSHNVNLTPRAIKNNIDKLMNWGIVDFEGGYYVCDPLFRCYLKAFR
jgi:uncharacterized protein